MNVMRLGWLALGLLGGVVAACSGDDDATIPNAPVDAGTTQNPAKGSGGAPSADDAGAPPDGAADAGTDAAAPISAPDDTWSWVDFPASKCGSGTATGLAVNPHANATELVIYFMGGGSCMTGETCWGASPGAVFMDGFGASDFATIQQKSYPILNRSLAANPMAAMNMVFVPYCTGDLHGGYGEADLALPDGGTKPTYFYGGFDMDLFLARLVPTFPGMKRVILAGTSAGGFGTFLNFDRVAKAYGGVRVDIIDDSGPPIPPAQNKPLSTSPWQLGKPASCPDCDSLRAIYDADRALQPNSRFGLLTFNRDSTIAPDFGYTVDQYPAIIGTFTQSIAADTHAAVFEVNLASGGEHVVESKLNLAPSYLPWMTKLLADDPTWGDVSIDDPNP